MIKKKYPNLQKLVVESWHYEERNGKKCVVNNQLKSSEDDILGNRGKKKK